MYVFCIYVALSGVGIVKKKIVQKKLKCFSYVVYSNKNIFLRLDLLHYLCF